MNDADADQTLMAYTLATYQQRRRRSDVEVAELLELDPAHLPMLRTERRPYSSDPDFKQEVIRIAALVGCHPRILTALLLDCEETEGQALS